MNPDLCLEKYLEYLLVEKGLAANTISAYAGDLRDFLGDLRKIGLKSLLNVRDKHLLGYMERQKKRGYAAHSLARKISSIKSFLVFLSNETQGTITVNTDLPSHKLPQSYPDYLLEEEIQMLLKRIDRSKYSGRRNALIVKLLYGLGLRVSELLDLRWAGINFQDHYLKVKGKGNKERILPLHPILINDIALHRKEQRTRVDSFYLFPGKKGRPLSRVGVWKIIQTTCRKCGLRRKVYPHAFRHSCATHMLQNGADIRALQEFLGHADLRTTERYTHLVNEQLKATIRDHHPLYR